MYEIIYSKASKSLEDINFKQDWKLDLFHDFLYLNFILHLKIILPHMVSLFIYFNTQDKIQGVLIYHYKSYPIT